QHIQNTIGLDKLPEKLQEVAQARLDNPSATIKELGELLPSGPVSKSGINHRLRRLNQYAENI
ncbi:DNA-binding protein WhiA, partial [Aerococcus sp. UMB9870]